MRWIIATAIAVLATSGVAATPSQAQTATAAVPSARQLDLTRRYINLMMSDQLEDAIRQVIGDDMANDTATQALPSEDRRFILDLTAELVADLVPQMVDQMVPVYAAVFTEEELVALVAFYDTEMGRSIADKSVMIMPESNRAIMSVMPQMMEKMAHRMCEYYSCTPAELQEMRSGLMEATGGSPSATPAPRTK